MKTKNEIRIRNQQHVGGMILMFIAIIMYVILISKPEIASNNAIMGCMLVFGTGFIFRISKSILIM